MSLGIPTNSQSERDNCINIPSFSSKVVISKKMWYSHAEIYSFLLGTERKCVWSVNAEHKSLIVEF